MRRGVHNTEFSTQFANSLYVLKRLVIKLKDLDKGQPDFDNFVLNSNELKT